MTSNEALLTVHKMQTNLWGIQESRSDKFARNAAELLSDEATIVTCPDCEGLMFIKVDCECYPFNPNGCAMCDYKGWTKQTCVTCKGEGQVLMHKDGYMEALL